jgi:hypothetical protein
MTSNLQNEIGLRAVKAVQAFLEKMEMHPAEQPFDSGTSFIVALEGPANQAVLQVHVDSERLAIHLIFDGFVPPDKRTAVAEYTTRANWGLIEGNFELNLENGTLRYKGGLDFTSCELTELWIRNCMLDGMNWVEIFAEGVTEVIAGTLDPEEANKEARLYIK